jgi:hypothetical protein
VADAGCILESLIDYVAPHDYIMPLDLGAKGRFVAISNVPLLHILKPSQVVILAETYQQMLVVYAYFAMARYMVPCWAWKSSFQTGLF